MATTIMVTHRQVGFHNWPDAPEKRAYLRSPHRHLFMMIVAMEMAHDDRFVEFHDLQDIVRDHYNPVHDFGPRSCETIAKELGQYLMAMGHRPAWVEVWEDQENGARVSF